MEEVKTTEEAKVEEKPEREFEAEVTVRGNTAALKVTEDYIEVEVYFPRRNGIGYWQTYYQAYRDGIKYKATVYNIIDEVGGDIEENIGLVRITKDQFELLKEEVFSIMNNGEDFDDVDVVEAARYIINSIFKFCDLDPEQLEHTESPNLI